MMGLNIYTCVRCQQPCPSLCEDTTVGGPFRGLCHRCTTLALVAERQGTEKLQGDLQTLLAALELVLPEIGRCTPTLTLAGQCPRPWMMRRRPYGNHRTSKLMCDDHARNTRRDGEEWHEAPWAAALRRAAPVMAAHRGARTP